MWSSGMLQADGQVFVHRPGQTVPMSAVKQQAVWVSLAEAQAYCNWAGGRIMTEAEYARAEGHARYDDRYTLHPNRAQQCLACLTFACGCIPLQGCFRSVVRMRRASLYYVNIIPAMCLHA